MRLRLKIEGVDFQLKIGYWKPHNPKISYDDEWCRVELYMSSYYLNTHNDGELLECGEVTWLRDQLSALLDGTLKEDKMLSFIEPDFEFELSVAKRLYSEPGVVWYKDGYYDEPLSAKFVITFWTPDGLLGTNQFKLSLKESDISAMLSYLRYVTREIEVDSEEIQNLLKSGQILPE